MQRKPRDFVCGHPTPVIFAHVKKSLDYQLLDFGEGRKLERFGEVVTDRPEVLAQGKRRLSAREWHETADLVYEELGEKTGRWHWHTPPRENWEIRFDHDRAGWKAILKPGKFKHVGIFPEQELHWNWLASVVKPGMRVLNLFAYTGAASLTAAIAGGDVYHVDSARSVIKTAADNARLSDISSIHWVVEDALAFAQKEVRRGRRYDVIIMDPPVFGKGKKKENRRLEDHLDNLVAVAGKLLSAKGTLLLNTYSPRTDIGEMVNTCEKNGLNHTDSGTLTVYDPKGRPLTLSSFVRAEKGGD